MQLLKLFIPITKVDEQKREIWGRAVQEVPDKSGEIFDYETSRPYFEKWSSDFEKSTEGKSLGNLRSMHNKIAAGKVIEMHFNDTERAIDICAKVVDDNEWEKCLEGVYTGFSVGGSYIKRWKDDNKLYRYTAKPAEMSLVDSPCIPTATFQCVKIDGSVIEKAFKAGDDNTNEQSPAQAETTPDLAKAEPKPILVKWSCGVEEGHQHDSKEQAQGCINEHLAKLEQVKTDEQKEDDTQANGKDGGEKQVKKGLYSVSTLGSILDQLNSLQQSLEYEAQYEGDNSPIPASIKEKLKGLVQDFKALATEEADELIADKSDGDAALAMSEKTDGLEKRGARNSNSDMQRIQNMHDLASELGANCSSEKADSANSLQKIESLQDELKKFNYKYDELQKVNDGLQKRVKELEALPAPAKGVTKVIAKEHDLGTKLSKSDDTKTNGSTDELNKTEPQKLAQDLIKAAHRGGGTDAFLFLQK